MTQTVDITRFWWAVQGSNLWPLPCQGTELDDSLAFRAITDAFGHVWFAIGSLSTLGHLEQENT